MSAAPRQHYGYAASILWVVDTNAGSWVRLGQIAKATALREEDAQQIADELVAQGQLDYAVKDNHPHYGVFADKVTP